MSYQAGRRCDMCGCESPYTHTCDGCETAQRYEERMESAFAAARAEGYAEGRADMLRPDTTIAAVTRAQGYAEAVADVIAHVHVSHPSWKKLDDSANGPRVNFVLGLLVADLESGAHIGAAKKGGSDGSW